MRGIFGCWVCGEGRGKGKGKGNTRLCVCFVCSLPYQRLIHHISLPRILLFSKKNHKQLCLCIDLSRYSNLDLPTLCFYIINLKPKKIRFFFKFNPGPPFSFLQEGGPGTLIKKLNRKFHIRE